MTSLKIDSMSLVAKVMTARRQSQGPVWILPTDMSQEWDKGGYHSLVFKFSRDAGLRRSLRMLYSAVVARRQNKYTSHNLKERGVGYTSTLFQSCLTNSPVAGRGTGWRGERWSDLDLDRLKEEEGLKVARFEHIGTSWCALHEPPPSRVHLDVSRHSSLHDELSVSSGDIRYNQEYF